MNANIFTKKSGTHLHYLKTAYRFLIESYLELLNNAYNVSLKNENSIRDDLVRIAKKKNNGLMFQWITEKPDLDNNSRIDILLITPLSLGDESKNINIECKIVGEDKYIDTNESFKRKSSPTNGIMSFLSGKYSEKMPIVGMIGFIKEGEIETKIDKIQKRITKHHSSNTIENLNKYEIVSDFNYSYVSRHAKLINSSKINIYHLFFDFV